MRTEAAAVTEWTVLVPRFDEHDMISLVSTTGWKFLTDRTHLRSLIDSGDIVRSASGQRLILADIDAGRLL